MKKLIIALPILFLAVSNAYGEDICSPHDFTCQRHWAFMQEIRPVGSPKNYDFKKAKKLYLNNLPIAEKLGNRLNFEVPNRVEGWISFTELRWELNFNL